MSGDAGTLRRERHIRVPRLLALCSLLLVAAGLALGSPRTSASPGWELILDLPGTDFQGIDFVSGSEGWLAAGAGLLHTTDGGVTWQEAAPIPGQDVDFADPMHGWLVGFDGTIYATADGVTWSHQDSGTNVHLTDVFAVGPQEAWVVGTGVGFSDVVVRPFPTALLHTTDGGATWEQIETPRGAELRVITFVGQRGWALGTCAQQRPPEPADVPDCGSNPVALLHTQDGGATWALLDTDLPGRFHRDLVFVSENRGWSISFEGGLFETNDGGLTWQRTQTGLLAVFEEVTFSDELHGWAVARRGCGQERCPLAVFRTVDGGENWSGQTIGFDQSNSRPILTLLATNQALYLTRSGLSKLDLDFALRSTDGGAVWQPMTHPGLDLREIAFADAEVGYALGGGGHGGFASPDLYRTSDAGRIWQRIGPAPVSGNGRLVFRDADRGFAAGTDCSGEQCVLTIRATNDGGQSWATVFSEPPGFPTFPFAFQFADDDHGWFVGESGFLITQDGGRTWSPQPLPFDHVSVRDADLADKDHAWAVITRPERLIRSSDSGRTWQVAPGTFPTGFRPTGQVDFVDRNHGWYSARVCEGIICNAIVLRATQDGGETWEEIDLAGERAFVEGLAFADRVNGWLIGGTCEERCSVEVMRTADGGRTWVSQLETQRFPRNFTFVDAETAWFWHPATNSVGFGAEVPARMQIYHTSDAGGGPTSIVPPDTGSASPSSGAAFPLPLMLTLAALGWGLIAAAVLGRGERRRS